MRVLEVIVIGGLIGLGAAGVYSSTKTDHMSQYDMKDSTKTHYSVDKSMMDMHNDKSGNMMGMSQHGMIKDSCYMHDRMDEPMNMPHDMSNHKMINEHMRDMHQYKMKKGNMHMMKDSSMMHHNMDEMDMHKDMKKDSDGMHQK